MRALATYPAVGDTQVCMGRVNGIWRTWMVHGKAVGKVHTHSDREQAWSVYDANRDVLKWKMGKIQ